MPDAVRNAAEGQVFPSKADVHSPEIMSQHMKDLARFFGADLVGIAKLAANQDDLPFAIVCGLRAEYDPREHPGVGGQGAALTGSYVAFNMGAAIREYGFRATRREIDDIDRLAVTANLGTLNADGRLTTPQLGSKVYVADAVLTDIPLQADSEEVFDWTKPTS